MDRTVSGDNGGRMLVFILLFVLSAVMSWAMENLDKLQQTFLNYNQNVVERLSGTRAFKRVFQEQFKINDSAEALGYWQVYDRTTDKEVNKENWSYDKEKRYCQD